MDRRDRDAPPVVNRRPYEKPKLVIHSLDEAILVAASRSGMGSCKQTFV